MTNRASEWNAHYMPYYYGKRKTEKYGDVIVTPNEWIRRRIKIGSHSYCPHFVDDEIKFTIQVENIGTPQHGISHYPRIYQRVGDGSYKKRQEINQTKPIPITGKADYTGDTKFFLGPDGLEENGYLIEQQGLVVFSEEIIHRDLATRELFLIVVGILGGGVLGCLGSIIAPLILAHFRK